MEAYHRAGVQKAEFCLVGWNIRGHDGRWPQILPPEEALGGEDGIALLNCYGQTAGIHHLCPYKQYGRLHYRGELPDGGYDRKRDCLLERAGQTYLICPDAALRLAEETLPAVAEYGFNGVHYIDVITCIPPLECKQPAHPFRPGPQRPPIR